MLGLAWLDWTLPLPGLVLLPLTLVLTAAATSEVLVLLAARDLRPSPSVVYGGTLLVVAANAVPMYLLPDVNPVNSLGWPLVALALATIWAFVDQMRRYEKPDGPIEKIALAVFSFVYVGVSMSFMIQLREFGGRNVGMVALASLLVVVKASDTGAYTVGRMFGKHKIAPVLSPGKTVEGALGGIVLACLGSWLVFEWLMPGLTYRVEQRPWWGWIAFGVIVAIAGVVGDLAESLFKRDMGHKDSSDWLPGLGGVLDLLDSLLLAAPIVYMLWLFGLVGP